MVQKATDDAKRANRYDPRRQCFFDSAITCLRAMLSPDAQAKEGPSKSPGEWVTCSGL